MRLQSNTTREGRVHSMKSRTAAVGLAAAPTLSRSGLDELDSAIAAVNCTASFQALDQAARDRGVAHDAGCGWAWT
jgi:hypothetical protein